MATSPTPDERIPEFILERFEDHSVETLRTISEFTDGDAMPSDVPNYIVEALTLQDDETEQAVGSYARALAEALDSNEAAEAGAEADAEPEDDVDQDDDDDDPPPPTMDGMFG